MKDKEFEKLLQESIKQYGHEYTEPLSPDLTEIHRFPDNFIDDILPHTKPKKPFILRHIKTMSAVAAVMVVGLAVVLLVSRADFKQINNTDGTLPPNYTPENNAAVIEAESSSGESSSGESSIQEYYYKTSNETEQKEISELLSAYSSVMRPTSATYKLNSSAHIGPYTPEESKSVEVSKAGETSGYSEQSKDGEASEHFEEHSYTEESYEECVHYEYQPDFEGSGETSGYFEESGEGSEYYEESGEGSGYYEEYSAEESGEESFIEQSGLPEIERHVVSYKNSDEKINQTIGSILNTVGKYISSSYKVDKSPSDNDIREYYKLVAADDRNFFKIGKDEYNCIIFEKTKKGIFVTTMNSQSHNRYFINNTEDDFKTIEKKLHSLI